MGILIAPQIKVSRNGLVMTRSPVVPIGHVEQARRGWVSQCKACPRRAVGSGQNVAANDLWDHWAQNHQNGSDDA